VRCRVIRQAAADHVAQVANRPAEQSRHVHPPLQARRHGVADQLPLVGNVLGLVRLGRGDVCTLGNHVVERRHDLGAAGAVDRRVVHLGDHPDPVVLEALDHPDLPQRASTVERDRCDAGCEFGQLPTASGSWSVHAMNVEVDVEVGVLDPDRMVEVERDVHQPASKRSDQVHALEDQLTDGLEGVAAGHGLGIEDRRHRHVHVGVGRFEVREGGVDPRQTFHGVPLVS